MWLNLSPLKSLSRAANVAIQAFADISRSNGASLQTSKNMKAEAHQRNSIQRCRSLQSHVLHHQRFALQLQHFVLSPPAASAYFQQIPTARTNLQYTALHKRQRPPFPRLFIYKHLTLRISANTSSKPPGDLLVTSILFVRSTIASYALQEDLFQLRKYPSPNCRATNLRTGKRRSYCGRKSSRYERIPIYSLTRNTHGAAPVVECRQHRRLDHYTTELELVSHSRSLPTTAAYQAVRSEYSQPVLASFAAFGPYFRRPKKLQDCVQSLSYRLRWTIKHAYYHWTSLAVRCSTTVDMLSSAEAEPIPILARPRFSLLSDSTLSFYCTTHGCYCRKHRPRNLEKYSYVTNFDFRLPIDQAISSALHMDHSCLRRTAYRSFDIIRRRR